MKNIKFILLALTVTLMFTACKKENGDASLTVQMKDAPANWDAVWVDVKAVEIHYSGSIPGPSGWVMLDTKAGIYDLLELQNGVTVILADNIIIPAGKVSQMRLVLGSNNSIVIDGITSPLTIPSSETSGIKINLNTNLNAGFHTVILFDFDVEKSIVFEGNGGIKLKPVLKIESLYQK